MSGLISLPSELIYSIFDYLQPSGEINETPDAGQKYENGDRWGYQESYRILAALQRTCKHFQPIAKVCLHRHYWTQYSRPNLAILEQLRTDDEIRQAIRHIRISSDDHKFMTVRAAQEVEQDWLRFPVLGWPDIFKIYRDPCQPEIALMVAQAPKLESLVVNCHGKGRFTPSYRAPIWLLPMIGAGKVWRTIPKAPNIYERLQTIDVDLQSSCSSDLAYLFCLPKLQRLSMDGLVHKPTEKPEMQLQPWPVPDKISSLRELKLTSVQAPAHIIAHMVRSCKSLVKLTCQCAMPAYTDGTLQPAMSPGERCRIWSVEILSSLEQPRESLEYLKFVASSFNHEDQIDFAPVYNFRNFHALATLNVPFTLLMGWWADGSRESYPRMSSTLPPNLEKLFIILNPFAADGADETTFLGALPPHSDRQSRSGRTLQYLHVTCEPFHWRHQPAPLYLHYLTADFQKCKTGFEFDYVICEDFKMSDGEDNPDGRVDEERMDMVAEELASYGFAGVEMAQHFDHQQDELTAAVLNVLQLEGSWILATEGEDITSVGDGAMSRVLQDWVN
jgi:hypothetical protein